MPASFDEPPSDRPRPPPPQSEIKDENVGTVLKIGGSACIALITCSCGAVFLIVPLMMLPYGLNPYTGLFALIGLVCTVVGCYAGCYGWKAADQGSKW